MRNWPVLFILLYRTPYVLLMLTKTKVNIRVENKPRRRHLKLKDALTVFCVEIMKYGELEATKAVYQEDIKLKLISVSISS